MRSPTIIGLGNALTEARNPLRVSQIDNTTLSSDCCKKHQERTYLTTADPLFGKRRIAGFSCPKWILLNSVPIIEDSNNTL